MTGGKRCLCAWTSIRACGWAARLLLAGEYAGKVESQKGATRDSGDKVNIKRQRCKTGNCRQQAPHENEDKDEDQAATAAKKKSFGGLETRQDRRHWDDEATAAGWAPWPQPRQHTISGQLW